MNQVHVLYLLSSSCIWRTAACLRGSVAFECKTWRQQLSANLAACACVRIVLYMPWHVGRWQRYRLFDMNSENTHPRWRTLRPASKRRARLGVWNVLSALPSDLQRTSLGQGSVRSWAGEKVDLTTFENLHHLEPICAPLTGGDDVFLAVGAACFAANGARATSDLFASGPAAIFLSS